MVAVMKSLPYVCVGLWPACDELHCVPVMVTVSQGHILIYEFVWWREICREGDEERISSYEGRRDDGEGVGDEMGG